MRLAKSHVDIGLFTNDIERQRAFWSETVGLRFDHRLDFGTGMFQYRYDAHGSVVKVNHFPTPLPARRPSGIAALTIARAAGPVWEGRDPDGDRVRLVPSGTEGVVGIGITLASPNPLLMLEFYVEVMEFEKVAPLTACCGDTLLFFESGPAVDNDPQSFIGGPAFRYLTIQIFDADAACNEIVARGGRLGSAPVNFFQIARYGFVLDPDGNWIEMSARASLTGILPPEPK